MKKNKKDIRAKRIETNKETVVSSEKQIVETTSMLVEPVCESAGMELVHVEYRRESTGRILRIYIDKPGGVSIEDCTYITRQIEDVLDVYLETGGAYNLEISSPGAERPISKQSDFERFRGNVAKIRTTRPFDGRKNFRGVLSGISNGVVSLLVEDKLISLPFDVISKARLVKYEDERP